MEVTDGRRELELGVVLGPLEADGVGLAVVGHGEGELTGVVDVAVTKVDVIGRCSCRWEEKKPKQ